MNHQNKSEKELLLRGINYLKKNFEPIIQFQKELEKQKKEFIKLLHPEKLSKTIQAYRKTLDVTIQFHQTYQKALAISNDAASNPKAPMGLHLVGFIYFNHRDAPQANRCFQFLIKALPRKIRFFKYLPLELPSDQEAEKESVIKETLWEHIQENEYEQKSFFALVKIAQQGKLDAIIVNAVSNKIKNVLKAQRAGKRGAHVERIEFDEKYAEQPRRREDGKIDEDYQQALSVRYNDSELDIEECLSPLREVVGETGNQILNYIIEYCEETEEISTNKMIATHIGKSERTVKKYRKKFKKMKVTSPFEKKS